MGKGWYALQDSNLRPLAPEASALFAELRAHHIDCIKDNIIDLSCQDNINIDVKKNG